MKISKTILVFSLSLTSLTSYAQRNLIERADDRNDIAVDRAQKERDQKEMLGCRLREMRSPMSPCEFGGEGTPWAKGKKEDF